MFYKKPNKSRTACILHCQVFHIPWISSYLWGRGNVCLLNGNLNQRPLEEGATWTSQCICLIHSRRPAGMYFKTLIMARSVLPWVFGFKTLSLPEQLNEAVCHFFSIHYRGLQCWSEGPDWNIYWTDCYEILLWLGPYWLVFCIKIVLLFFPTVQAVDLLCAHDTFSITWFKMWFLSFLRSSNWLTGFDKG